jgi:hypothetical protein
LFQGGLARPPFILLISRFSGNNFYLFTEKEIGIQALTGEEVFCNLKLIPAVKINFNIFSALPTYLSLTTIS